MTVICPKCGQPIAAANINVARDAAFCAACGEMHRLSVLSASAPPAQTAAMPQTPAQPVYQQPPCQSTPPYQAAPVPQYQQQPPAAYAPQTAPPPAPPLVVKGWQYFAGMFKKYAVFSGRASMEEWLAVVVINSMFMGILGGIDNFLLVQAGVYLYAIEGTLLGVFKTIYTAAVILPLLGVYIRRMHDIDKSGWCCLIPVYGWIILPFCDGTRGPNRFGPDPKQTNGQ
jgi:uncharacterized membrane protein YhaH (DUF805 family)